MEIELKECPFCGSKPVMVADPNVWFVLCPHCGSSGSGGKRDHAQESWNTRFKGQDPNKGIGDK